MRKTFAIETSCDDTSVGIVSYQDGVFSVEKLLAYSQISDHQKYGGVVPEIAYRLHSEKIIHLIEEIGLESIESTDCISVTTNPGLGGSLLVGKTAAAMLGERYNKKVIGVNHIYGHIFSLLLERNVADLPFPWVVLTASGGHNELYLISNNSKCGILNSKGSKELNLPSPTLEGATTFTKEAFVDEKFQNSESKIQNKNDIEHGDPLKTGRALSIEHLEISKLGHTLDDAAGECFDKVARMMGGPYPGGVWIGQKALQGKPNERVKFKRIFLDHEKHDFSFSGMKSQVHYLLSTLEKEGIALDEQLISDIAYEFQEAVVEVLAKKLVQAAHEFGAKTLGIAGGVSANDRLFQYAAEYAQKRFSAEEVIQTNENSAIISHTFNGQNIPLVRPMKKVYSTDNAAMIGVVGLITKTKD